MDCPLFDKVETATMRNVFAIFRRTACQRFSTLSLALPVSLLLPPPPLPLFLLLLLFVCRCLRVMPLASSLSFSLVYNSYERNESSLLLCTCLPSERKINLGMRRPRTVAIVAIECRKMPRKPAVPPRGHHCLDSSDTQITISYGVPSICMPISTDLTLTSANQDRSANLTN